MLKRLFHYIILSCNCIIKSYFLYFFHISGILRMVRHERGIPAFYGISLFSIVYHPCFCTKFFCIVWYIFSSSLLSQIFESTRRFLKNLCMQKKPYLKKSVGLIPLPQRECCMTVNWQPYILRKEISQYVSVICVILCCFHYIQNDFSVFIIPRSYSYAIGFSKL